MSTHPIIAEDIRGVLSRTQPLWPDLKGASVFITGATGFFGIWLLETLLTANREFSLGLRILALSIRNGRLQTPLRRRDMCLNATGAAAELRMAVATPIKTAIGGTLHFAGSD